MGKQSLECPVVGLNYRVTASTRRLLAQKVTEGPISVTVQREPKNKHDENAIKVVISEGKFTGLHIGYIPRSTAAVMAPALDKREIDDVTGYLTDVADSEATMLLQFGKVKKDKRKTKPRKKARN